MPGLIEANGPTYISSHSADIILSDIRPFKLKNDALRSINVLLDEFLYSILSTSGSLLTDKLRASLLVLLPTSLGKEALLEAEVELRAYWERTAPAGIVPSLEDDFVTFHLPWCYELLRLKCEAFSTLNEADEDPTIEGRINEKFGRLSASPPKVALVPPAALYLTAILEATSEHILSNIGRVAARDSSRTSATMNDLFTALCEDDSIYGFFRTMKVYDQIEQLSKTPKSRRSKSFTRNDRTSTSQTSSPQQESSITHSLTGSISRQSSDGSSMTTMAASNTGSRSSFDKSRAIRMFTANSKASIEREDNQTRHKKSISLLSDSRNTSITDNDGPGAAAEDAAMLQEFDDLMRSTSTMKMSLTPDRLKTMEVYKQEKDQRGNRRPVPLSIKPETDILSSSRTSSQRPSLRHVDSIVEDDEETGPPKQPKAVRTRQASVATPPSATPVGTNSLRARSVSTSSAAVPSDPRRVNRSPPVSVSALHSKVASIPPTVSSRQTTMAYSRENRSIPARATESGGFPPRTRMKQRNRESLDLDDVMGSSDGEELVVPAGLKPRAPTSPKRGGVPHAVSASTRELMDFLAEGPPEPQMAREGKQLTDFLAEGPANYNTSAISLESKPKSTGRLQRMISKLNIGNGEKAKAGSDSPSKPTQIRRHGTAERIAAQTPSVNALSSLANRPIPPRPLRPISPPSSPSQGSIDENYARPSSRKTSQSQDNTTVREKPVIIAQSPTPLLPLPMKDTAEKPAVRSVSYVNGNTIARDYTKETITDTHTSVIPTRTTSHSSRKQPTSTTLASSTPAEKSGIFEGDARDIQRLFASATTADECRLIFDMFLTRSGVVSHTKPQEIEVPYPSPSPSVVKHSQFAVKENYLENSLVELLLGSNSAQTHLPKPRRLPRFSKRETEHTQLPRHENSLSTNGLKNTLDFIPHSSHTQGRPLVSEIGM